MKKDTTRQILIFFGGLIIVTFVTIFGSLAFLEPKILLLVRNVAITDVVFVILYAVWIKLHKGYETMYKSGLELEEKRQ